MPPSPSPLGVMLPQKRKPGKQKENTKAETGVRRIRRTKALPFIKSPQRQALAAKNLNISTVERAVGTPPRASIKPALFTPPRPNLAGRTITPPRKVPHPYVPADPTFSSPICRASGGLTVTPERANLGPFALDISRPRAFRRASNSGFAPLWESPTQRRSPILDCSPVRSPLPALRIAPRPPLSFDDFNLHLILGQGGQGIVYLGTYKNSTPANRKPYAIKVISKTSIDRLSVNFVLQEQRILHDLSRSPHPNVMCLDASFHDDKYFYLVNEAYSGGDLESFLARCGKFHEALAGAYAAEMVLGIQHLHRMGIIHRDLKLQNVFVKGNGHIVIGDMGLVRSFADEVLEDGTPKTLEYHFTTWCCGTLSHMAPEVFTLKIYSYEVDWWALGIMIYHMMLGRVRELYSIFFCNPDLSCATIASVLRGRQRADYSGNSIRRPGFPTLWLSLGNFFVCSFHRNSCLSIEFYDYVILLTRHSASDQGSCTSSQPFWHIFAPVFLWGVRELSVLYVYSL
jgi:serine/threonine protein kinase